MLCKRVIPCLDVKDGRIVKGTNFLNLKDAGDPVTVSKLYSDQGADEICVLDISATIESRKTTLHLVEKIASNVFVPLSVGGGVSCIKDIEHLLNAGADKVAINSAAVKEPLLIQKSAAQFGSQCIIVAIDAKWCENEYLAYTHGGQKPTDLNAIDWAKKVNDLGAGEILLTSIDFDGTKNGFDCTLTKKISESTSIPVIASGGAGKLAHFCEGLLKGQADAVLAASLFHFNQISIHDVKMKMKAEDIPVRI